MPRLSLVPRPFGGGEKGDMGTRLAQALIMRGGGGGGGEPGTYRLRLQNHPRKSADILAAIDLCI